MKAELKKLARHRIARAGEASAEGEHLLAPEIAAENVYEQDEIII